jgi:hypothetical protein
VYREQACCRVPRTRPYLIEPVPPRSGEAEIDRERLERERRFSRSRVEIDAYVRSERESRD